MQLPQDDAFGYLPRTNEDALSARLRGWWVSAFEHLPNGMVCITYSFSARENQTTYITASSWNADVVINLGRMYAGLGVLPYPSQTDDAA